MKTLFTNILILFFAFGISNGKVNKIAQQLHEPGVNKTLKMASIDTTIDFATHDLDTIYNTLKYDDYWGSFIISEIASDECAGGGGLSDNGNFQRYDRGLPLPDANPNSYLWDNYYKGISRANNYLNYEGRIDWTGHETQRLQYQAEARFLRAYFHFYLTRMFGKIPALDHVLATGEAMYNFPVEDIYSFIINDLKFCAENGLSSPYSGSETNWGRATKWAAEALIGRVYLFYNGYYNDNEINGFTESNARAYIDDVIQNGGFGLVPEFASLWRVPAYSELGYDTSIASYAGEVNPEVVWSVRYYESGTYDIVGGSRYARWIGPRSTNINPYGQGWGAMTVLPTLWLAYNSTDKRRTATILSWADEGKTYNWSTNYQAQYTGYNSKKYEIASVKGKPEPSNWQWSGFEDYIVIRYADVLLMGAEFHLMNEDNATALSYTNMIRERAFGNSTHNYVSITMDSIFTERKLELACEDIRYWDILRSCKGDSTKLASILTYTDTTDGGDYSQTANVSSKDVDGNNFVATKGLFQKPYVIYDVSIGNDKNISLEYCIYPNPNSGFVTLKVIGNETSSIYFQLFDMNGRLLENKQISEKETNINMSRYVPAAYLLKVVKMTRSLNQVIKTFKIVKN